MRGKKRSRQLRVALAIVTVLLFATTSWANDEKVLHSFGRGTDGGNPTAGLIFDADGNLYGTTAYGGIHGNNCAYGCGTVFELSPGEDGGWTEKVLHSFNGTDGTMPGASLVFDAAGNLYGTTSGGGTYAPFGTVFELSPNGRGGWTEKVLHNFDNGTDGAFPDGLIWDAAGNLYGTASGGGIHPDGGTAFELSPNEDGSWTETVLHSFGGGTDGVNPAAGLIFDAAGNLYGTTSSGGIHCVPFGCGTVFELSPREDGGWTETVLHSFGLGTDGTYPHARPVFDAAGNLYGTTSSGGIHGCIGGSNSCGTLFELSPKEGRGWTETVLHNFGNGTDGFSPAGNLILDAVGNLYGITQYGGIHTCDYQPVCGTVFELSPREDGGWTETVLHSFGRGNDGQAPNGSLIWDAAGNLYGTTIAGGIHDNCAYGTCGTVFEIMH